MENLPSETAKTSKKPINQPILTPSQITKYGYDISMEQKETIHFDSNPTNVAVSRKNQPFHGGLTRQRSLIQMRWELCE